MLVIQTSVEYTEVLRFLAAAARIKPVLRGFERRSRYYNLVESMRIAMELGDYSWVRDCQIAMTEYAYALGMDKYRRILTELELKRRTLSEADFAASVYFAFIDMGSHYVAGDLLCEELNLIFQRRVKQHRSAQFWLNGISEASLRIAKTHPGCDLGRWQAKLTDQPFGSFDVNMVQVSTLYKQLEVTLGLSVTQDWTDMYGKKHAYYEEVTIMGKQTVVPRDKDILAYGRALATVDINKLYLDPSRNINEPHTPQLPPFQSAESIDKQRATALRQRDSTGLEEIKSAFNNRAPCEYFLTIYIVEAERRVECMAEAERTREVYRAALIDEKYVGAGRSAKTPFGTVEKMRVMVYHWRQFEEGQFAARTHHGSLFIASENNLLQKEAMAILSAMKTQKERDRVALSIARQKLKKMERMPLEERPPSQINTKHTSVLGIDAGATAHEAVQAFLDKVIERTCGLLVFHNTLN